MGVQCDYSYEQNMMQTNFLFRSKVGKVLIRAVGSTSVNSLNHPPDGGGGDGACCTPELAPASDGAKVGMWHEMIIDILV